jgi:dihydrofolate reductase
MLYLHRRIAELGGPLTPSFAMARCMHHRRLGDPSTGTQQEAALPKYVVSSTLKDPGWNGSTVLQGDVLESVSKLKQQIAGNIVVPASFQLVRTLVEHDLVDELRLKIFPVVLGVGERLFRETGDKKPMRLVDTQTVEGGILALTYQAVRGLD